MTAYADVKPKTVTAAESEFDRAEKAIPRPEIRITQSNRGSSGTLGFIVAAIVLIAGAYLLYTNYSGPVTVVPTVTQNNITVPAPDATDPATPVPAAPPVSDTTTPPATGAAPQPPVAPAQ
jgi:hypothetical protein